MLDIPFNPYGIDNPLFFIVAYFVAYVVVAIIIFIGRMFFQDLFEGRQQKTKRSEFQKFLRYNNSVKQYNKQYEMFDFLERPKAILYLYGGLFMGIFVPIIFVFIALIVSLIIVEEWTELIFLYSFIFSSTLTLSFAFIFILYLINFIKSEVDRDIFLKKYLEYTNKSTMILFYIIFSYPAVLFLFIVFFEYIIINLDLGQNSLSNFANLILFGINLILLLSIPLLFLIIKQDFKNRLKKFLNSEGKKSFPFVYVLTKEQSQICGIITDIFNDKLLILEDNGIKKVTMWDSVCTLEVSEGEIRDLSSQKKLRDFI